MSCYIITSPVEIKTSTTPVLLKLNDTTKADKWLFQNDGSNNLLIGSDTKDDAVIIDPLTGDITLFNVVSSTITDPTNLVRATQLATTGADVVISGAAPPAVGQVLRATAPTTATWQTVTGAGNNIAYTLANIKAVANTIAYSTIGYFPWDDSRHMGYTAGAVVYRTVIGNRDLDIRLQDVTNAVTLGSDLGVTTTAGASRSFSVINPTTDAEVQLQIRKSANGGANPQILGAVLEYDV